MAASPRAVFEHFQEIDAKDHLGKWYQAFVIEAADDGIAVHFSGWSQIWDEFVPANQIASRVRARSRHTAVGRTGPEAKQDVRALYSTVFDKEADALRLLRKLVTLYGVPAQAVAPERGTPVSAQDLKKELDEFRLSVYTTENMIALFFSAHATVSPEDAKVILHAREMLQHVKLLINT